MIESFHVSGFKLFRDLTLPRLGRLNLFLGENNSGKSCLLEAISLYAGQTPVADVVQTAAGRSEESLRPWDPVDLTEDGTSLRHPVFDLFHRVGTEFASEFAIEKIGDPNSFRVQSGPYRSVRDEQDFIRYVPATKEDVQAHDNIEQALAIFRGDRFVGLITRRRLPIYRGRVSTAEKFLNEDATAVAFVPANGFSNEKAASMWDALVQGPGQELVLSWLRMLDPGIEDLAYIAGRRDARVALIKIKGQGRVPLRSMGDGLTKLFHIALAVASASQGILLIDEFENGLHWTVQEKLWIAIAHAARASNVQVFSTTHSRDCIQGFAAAVAHEEASAASIYRLERRGEDVFAVELPLLNVDAALREHEEVR